eukprot:CAMPEP_0118798592 /NCGR_PEP_ID=MMETSP1161-20130426/960_1 /TAXON_ID=249345 /ORGANISM="Picochlorum oklahomensis, Strain CCMP2329" /LENGTH=174 /DNA_ID=CAMNT_0006726055 /DNA_START=104 /DNA_END=628 /DNA_ORIENTATION=+
MSQSRLGICETPFTWSRLQDVIQDGSLEALSTLGRTPEVWREYRDFKNSYILQHYASTVDYLMIQIFQCPCTTNNEGKKVHIKPDDFESNHKIIWRKNDFPYSVESGIEHYILWANVPLAEKDVERHVQKQFPNNTKDSLLWFVNPMELQSVPELWHAHIMANMDNNARVLDGV